MMKYNTVSVKVENQTRLILMSINSALFILSILTELIFFKKPQQVQALDQKTVSLEYRTPVFSFIEKSYY